jgi:hypothetical protein
MWGHGGKHYSLHMSLHAEYPVRVYGVLFGLHRPFYRDFLDPLAGGSDLGSHRRFRVSNCLKSCSQGNAVAFRADGESAE